MIFAFVGLFVCCFYRRVIGRSLLLWARRSPPSRPKWRSGLFMFWASMMESRSVTEPGTALLVAIDHCYRL